MDVLQKLQLRPGATVAVLGAPPDSPVEVAHPAPPEDAEAVLAFVRAEAELDGLEVVLAAARADRLTWVAYPKAGALGTDLNRDRLAAAMTVRGLRPVRQVAIDDVWSALRFRPALLD